MSGHDRFDDLAGPAGVNGGQREAFGATEPFALDALQNPSCPVFELLCSL